MNILLWGQDIKNKLQTYSPLRFTCEIKMYQYLSIGSWHHNYVYLDKWAWLVYPQLESSWYLLQIDIWHFPATLTVKINEKSFAKKQNH